MHSIKAGCARAAFHTAVLAGTRNASIVNGAKRLFYAPFALIIHPFPFYIFEKIYSRLNQNGKFCFRCDGHFLLKFFNLWFEVERAPKLLD